MHSHPGVQQLRQLQAGAVIPDGDAMSKGVNLVLKSPMNSPVLFQTWKLDALKVSLFQGQVPLDMAFKESHGLFGGRTPHTGFEGCLVLSDGHEQGLILIVQPGDPTLPGNGFLNGLGWPLGGFRMRNRCL
jgi:hypothetical protein